MLSGLCRQELSSSMRRILSLRSLHLSGVFYSTSPPNTASEKTAPSGSKGVVALHRHLAQRIQSTGPIPVADYMRECLTHPTMGYYMTRDVFGQHGDFITSPEISQLFGEMIGVWIVHEWLRMGQPSPFQIVELGPGRGTLATDILRVINRFPDLRSAAKLSLALVEVSPALRYIQHEVLHGPHRPFPRFLPDPLPSFEETVEIDGVPVNWFQRLQDVPRQSGCFVAHEFLDALPIHKFQFRDGQWCEVLVDIVRPDQKKKDEKVQLIGAPPSLSSSSTLPPPLRFVLSRGPTAASSLYLPLLKRASVTGREHLEVCPEAGLVAQHLAQRVARSEGTSCALMADYGLHSDNTDTFRGFKSHKLYDPLERPGSCDLTADVDFEFIGKMAVDAVGADKISVHGPVSQRFFLLNMGIMTRLQKLLDSSQSQASRTQVQSGCDKLIDPSEMGNRFQFMALLPPSSSSSPSYTPPGFVGLEESTSNQS